MLKTMTATLLVDLMSTSMAAAQRSLLDLRPGKKQSSERAIVFVHGWCSSAATAFNAKGASVDWPGLLNKNRDPKKAHRNFDVFAFDYSAAQTRQTSLLDLAQSLIERLDDQSIFSKYAEVYFVAHSLGGLVVKKTILVLREKKRRTRLDRIGSVIFLGVPSNGNWAADWISNGIIGTLTNFVRSLFGSKCGNHDLVDELRTKSKSDKLRFLESSWQNYLEAPKTKSDKWRIPTYCGYQGKPIGNFVVPQTGARSKCGEERRFPNKNHFGLVAPSDASDEFYIWVGNRLKLAVERFDALKRFLVSSDGNLQNRLIQKGIVKQRRKRRPAKILPDIAETIDVSDDDISRLRNLRLRDGMYSAPTFPRLLQKISRRNPCIRVQHSREDRTIKIQLEQTSISTCKGDGGRQFQICQSDACTRFGATKP